MNHTRWTLAACAALVAACSQAPAATPSTAQAPAALTAADAVTVNVGDTAGVNATVSFALAAEGIAKRHILTPAVTTHHWVAADIVKYVVTLQKRTSTGPDQFSAIGAGVSVDVPQTGAGAKTKAVFNNLSQGQYYRAFVSAVGHKAGSGDGDTALNTQATADYKDFDFTASQDQAPTLSQVVTIHFDGVNFSGTGNISFASPADGAYVNPSDAPVATAAGSSSGSN